MHRKLFLLLLYMNCAIFTMAEPKLTVVDMNGQEQEFALSQLGKITFANDVMYLYDETGILLGFTDVENVGQIVMEEVNNSPTSFEQIDNRVHIFPNPAQDALIIVGIPANQVVRVYNLQGRMMSATTTQYESTLVDVRDFQQGTYLLQVGAQVVKFIKE